MPRYAYVNGRYLPHDDAAVHVEDRGFQFADGVYEVVAVIDGRLLDEDGHIARLERSLRELRIPWPVKPGTLHILMRELARRNGVRSGLIYVQVTRGVAPRNFRFPLATPPTLVMTCRRTSWQPRAALEQGISVITLPDIRWLRRDIKTVALVAQVLGKQAAAEAGAFEGWMIDADGAVTEGTSSNAWIVTDDGVLVTRPASNMILNGITRQTLLKLAREMQLRVDERPFTAEEARNAREAFISAAGVLVLPVVRIDGCQVGDGKPGTLTRRLREAYLRNAGVNDPVLGRML